MKPDKLEDTILNSSAHDDLQKEFTKIVVPLKEQYALWITNLLQKTIDRIKPEIEGKPYHKTFGDRNGPHHVGRLPFGGEIRSMFGSKFSPENIEKTRISKEKYGTEPYLGGGMNDGQYLDPDYKTRIEKEANHQAAMFADAFLSKNVQKFAGIVGNRKIKSMSHSVGGDLDGALHVELEDGSKFKASFNTISKRSVNGLYFNQWPTKFHDVVLPDGSKMSTPSEDRMKKIFAFGGEGHYVASEPEKPKGDVSFRVARWPTRGVDVYIGRKKLGPGSKKSIDGKTVYGYGGFTGTRDEVFAHVKAKYAAPDEPAEAPTPKLDSTPLINTAPAPPQSFADIYAKLEQDHPKQIWFGKDMDKHAAKVLFNIQGLPDNAVVPVFIGDGRPQTVAHWKEDLVKNEQSLKTYYENEGLNYTPRDILAHHKSVTATAPVAKAVEATPVEEKLTPEQEAVVERVRAAHAARRAAEASALDTAPLIGAQAHVDKAQKNAIPVPAVAGLNHPTGRSKGDIVAAMAHSMPAASAHQIAKAVHQHHPEITYANANYYARKMKR